jgi:hypothetical protein
MNDDNTMYNCKLRLAADIARIDNIILVDSRDIDEVRHLKTEPAPQLLPMNDEDETMN